MPLCSPGEGIPCQLHRVGAWLGMVCEPQQGHSQSCHTASSSQHTQHSPPHVTPGCRGARALPSPQSSSPFQALNFSSFDKWDLETGGEVEEWLCGEINPFLRPVKGERGHFTALLSSINIMRVRRKVSASKKSKSTEIRCLSCRKGRWEEPLATVRTVFTGQTIANTCPEKPYLKRIKLNLWLCNNKGGLFQFNIYCSLGICT